MSSPSPAMDDSPGADGALGDGLGAAAPNDSSDSSFADSFLLASEGGGPPPTSTPPDEPDEGLTMDRRRSVGARAASRPKVLLLGELEMPGPLREYKTLAATAELIRPQATHRAAFLAEARTGAFDGTRVIARTFASVAVTGRVDEELVAALPSSVRYICHNGAGYDQVSVAACTRRRIRVAHTPGAVDDCTADTAAFLILGCLRNLAPLMAHARAGRWRGGDTARPAAAEPTVTAGSPASAAADRPSAAADAATQTPSATSSHSAATTAHPESTRSGGSGGSGPSSPCPPSEGSPASSGSKLAPTESLAESVHSLRGPPPNSPAHPDLSASTELGSIPEFADASEEAQPPDPDPDPDAHFDPEPDAALPALGHDPRERTLGIVGLGGIGANLARKMAGFGMRIVYHSRRARSAAEEAAAGGARRVSFEALLRESDVVSLNVPLTPETHHLIGPRELALLKPDAVLVNTARGAIVDEGALAAHLAAHPRARAGLDVFENEPHIHPGLRNTRQALLLPHCGTWTAETQAAMESLVVANVRSALKGEGLVSGVPEQRGLAEEWEREDREVEAEVAAAVVGGVEKLELTDEGGGGGGGPQAP